MSPGSLKQFLLHLRVAGCNKGGQMKIKIMCYMWAEEETFF